MPAHLLRRSTSTRLEAVWMRLELALDRVDVRPDPVRLLHGDLLRRLPWMLAQPRRDLVHVVALVVLLLMRDGETLRLRVESKDQRGPRPASAPTDLREREARPVPVELLEPEHQVRPAAPGARRLVELIPRAFLARVMREHERNVLEEPDAPHQRHELARVLRRADAVDPERVERVADHEVDRVLLHEGTQARSVLVLREAEPAPVERVDVHAALELVRPHLQLFLELRPERLAWALVLDEQHVQRAGDLEAEPVDPRRQMERRLCDQCRLALATLSDHDCEAGRRQQDLVRVADQRSWGLALRSDELAQE